MLNLNVGVTFKLKKNYVLSNLTKRRVISCKLNFDNYKFFIIQINRTKNTIIIIVIFLEKEIA